MSHLIHRTHKTIGVLDCKRTLFFFSLILLFSTNAFSQHGLKAEYYDGTDFNRLDTVVYVPNIDQEWFDVPPVPGIDPHECSIRWTGDLVTGKSGKYTFSAQVDDGIRVWIDEEIIIDQWDLHDVGRFTGSIDLVANKKYDLKVEYFNGLLEGEVRLLWKKHKEDPSWYEWAFGDGIEFTVIPTQNFLAPPKPIELEKEVVVEKVEKKALPKPVKKKEVVTRVEKKVTPPPPPPKPKEVSQPSPPKPKVSAKVVEKYLPKNVQFKKGKTVILESSFKELNDFIEFMKRHQELNVMVEGHTDVVGDPEMNLQLSKDRAEVIARYLTEKGIDKERITHEGFGGNRPLVVPPKGKYHPANRRVVFIIEDLE